MNKIVVTDRDHCDSNCSAPGAERFSDPFAVLGKCRQTPTLTETPVLSIAGRRSSHFDYIQAPLGHSGKDDLLKPANNSFLCRSGKHTGGTAGLGAPEPISACVSAIQSSITSFFERCSAWSGLSKEDGINDAICRELAEQQGFSFPNSFFTVFSVHIKNQPSSPSLAGNFLAQFSMAVFLEKYLRGKGTVQYFPGDGPFTQVFCIFNHNLADREVELLLDHCIENAKTFLKIECVIGTGRSLRGFHSLKKLCLEAESLSSQTVVLADQNVINRQNLALLSLKEYTPNPQAAPGLAKLLRTGPINEEEVGMAVDSLLQDMLSRKISCQAVCTVCRDFYQRIADDLRNRIADEPIPLDSGYLEQILRSCVSINGLKRSLTLAIVRLGQYIQQINLPIGKKIVSEIKLQIEKEYGNDIKLSKLASDYYINPSYLSILFRQETGVNFSQYLTGIRLKKAKELLETTSFSTGKIAKLIGYNDRNYFAAVFSKNFNMTPMQYRDSFISRGSNVVPIQLKRSAAASAH